MKRIASLDALRGVAAFSVVICHLLAALFFTHYPAISPFWSAFFARWAVLTFFALSGYVLALPYFNGREPAYRVFVVRRFCRIYLPYAAVVTVAGVLFYFFLGAGTHRDIFENMNASTIVQSFLMTGLMPSVSIDPVTWSLIVEMRLAFIFPLLVWLVRRDWKVTIFGSVLTSLVLLTIIDRFHLDWFGHSAPVLGTTFFASLMITVYLGTLFVGGIVLAKFDSAIATFAQRHQAVLWALTFALMAFGLLYDPLMLAGALLLVALVPNTPAVVRAFTWLPIVWVGRISYSLYLVHLVVLIAIWRVTGSGVVAAITFIPVSLGVAEIFYRYVEVPSIALGRTLTRAPRTAAGTIVANAPQSS